MIRRFTLPVELCVLQLVVYMSANCAAAVPRLLQVNGMVSDALGRPVNGVLLILQRVDGQIIARTKSQPSGHFAFADVRPGTYAIVANKSGFATAAAVVTVTTTGADPVDISMAAQTALSMPVAKRVDLAPSALGGRSALPTAAAQHYFRNAGDDRV